MNPYYEPLTPDELEDSQTIEDQIWMQEQDAKAGYVRPGELDCVNNEDNTFFGMKKSFVFLHVWFGDLRAWVPTQSDLEPAWKGKMTGSETDFDISMDDGSLVRIDSRSQKMIALDENGKELVVLTAE